jgi:peptidoglycan/LPS O-acetylase OafA/YrhL
MGIRTWKILPKDLGKNMPPTKPHEVFGIQILRGVAALAVVIHHALEMSNGSVGRFSPDWLTTSGAAGVDIFFVISGFIMVHTSFLSGCAPLRPLIFLKKRALRIYPFYWICLIAMSLLFAVGFMKSHNINMTKFLLSALLFPGDPLIDVSWTLSYEVFST